MSPSVFKQFTSFLNTLRVFPPYFDHDAFMHHPMHVLDAPDFGVMQVPGNKKSIAVYDHEFGMVWAVG